MFDFDLFRALIFADFLRNSFEASGKQEAKAVKKPHKMGLIDSLFATTTPRRSPILIKTLNWGR